MEVGLAADGIGVSSEVASGLLAAGVGKVGHQAAGCWKVGEPRTPASFNVTMVLRLRDPLSCGCASLALLLSFIVEGVLHHHGFETARSFKLWVWFSCFCVLF